MSAKYPSSFVSGGERKGGAREVSPVDSAPVLYPGEVLSSEGGVEPSGALTCGCSECGWVQLVKAPDTVKPKQLGAASRDHWWSN